MSEIPDNESDNNIPLQKPKTKLINKKEESIIVEDKETTGARTGKPKRAKSQKQIEQFDKLRLVRQQKIEERKKQKEIEASKLLLENGYSITEKNQVKQKVSEQNDNKESEDDDEEIIYIKKEKPKRKKKTRKIIVESESESDTESEEENKKQEKPFKSQQNKKSLIKIHQPVQKTQTKQSKNYFVD